MKMQAVENFRSNLADAMHQKGISQRTLAEKANMSYPYINRILRGIASPSLDICDKLADACGLRLEEMISKKRSRRRISA